MKYFLTCITLLSLSISGLQAQAVLINEVVSSNSTLLDEDGDSPDWFELRNPTQTAVNLQGWTITDRRDKPTKWTFPSMNLSAGEYVQIWASGKDKATAGLPRTVIDRGTTAKYLISQTSGTGWTEIDYNDAFWSSGVTGLGYGDDDDATIIPAGTIGVLVRIPFQVNDVIDVQRMIFDIDFDDAFVAYINGQEIARSNVVDQGNGIFIAETDREAQLYMGGATEQHFINNPADYLQSGTNVLSIRLLNVSISSSDLTCIPFLTLMVPEGSNGGSIPPNFLDIPPTLLHTNFKLASGGETLYLFDTESTLVDSLAFANIPTDASYGRALNGTATYFTEPTPGAANVGNTFSEVITEQVAFSNPGGFVDQLSLSLSTEVPEGEIRYTLDATVPTGTSLLYSNPIAISENTIVRAKIFKSGHYPSETAQRSYLFDDEHDIPVISLVTAPDHFFDEDEGIYVLGNNADGNFPHFGANFWEDWERPVHLTIFEDGISTFQTGAGVKIFGGWSRGQDQKSLSLFARSQYGNSSFDYKMFETRETTSYQAWVLRNSGNDFLSSNIRDAALTSLMEGADLEFQAYRPMALYINGQYWGYHNVREKVNEHFIGERTGLDPDEVDILETNSFAAHGSNNEYLSLIEFVDNNDLSIASNYTQVAEQIDIENFSLYYATQIYFDNTDWPGNNIKYWKGTGGKWRWILFDTDFGFGIWDSQAFRNNTLLFALNPTGQGWPNPAWSTLLFRKLMSNTTFQHTFVNRLADELNSRFLPGRVAGHIDLVSSITNSEAPRHYNRWGGLIGFRWQKVDEMKSFATNRQTHLKNHVLNTLNLPAYHRLTISNPQHQRGSVVVNSRLNIGQSFWSGDYFESVPITLEAVPDEGYDFSHWEGEVESIQSAILIDVDKAMTVTPIFTIATSTKDEDDSKRLTVFPSPTAGKATLSYSSSDIGYSQIDIYDANGSRVSKLSHLLHQGDNTISLDLSNRPAGLYKIRLSVGGKISTASVVKI